MTVYYLVIGVMLTLGSLTMIAWPRQVWLFTHGWRVANPQEVQLTAAHVAWSRLSGAMGVIIGIVLLFCAFK